MGHSGRTLARHVTLRLIPGMVFRLSRADPVVLTQSLQKGPKDPARTKQASLPKVRNDPAMTKQAKVQSQKALLVRRFHLEQSQLLHLISIFSLMLQIYQRRT